VRPPIQPSRVLIVVRRTSQVNPEDVLIRVNQILNGWANYFEHAVAKHTFRRLRQFVRPLARCADEAVQRNADKRE